MFHSPRSVGLLREDPDEEIALHVGLKGGRHDAVSAGGQLVATAHLSHVDKGGRLGHGGVVLEELHVQGTSLCMTLIQLEATKKKKLAINFL